MSYFSFSLALVCIYSSLYEKVNVVWIKINIQCKSFSLNILKYIWESCRERGAGDAEG